MRFTHILLSAPRKNTARRYQGELVPFQQLLPLQLKNSVSGKSDKTKEAVCLQELSMMFACLKENEFNEQICSKEVKNFQTCYVGYTSRVALQEQQDRKGILTPGERKLTHRQMNQLLKRYPAQTR